jgi:uncharacterized protein (DUF433 family)
MDNYTKVRLTRDIGIYPKGSLGLIVEIYGDGTAYDVDMFNILEPLWQVTAADIEVATDDRQHPEAELIAYEAWYNYMAGIDWSACEAVELVQGRCGGLPVVKDTRMHAQAVVDNHEGGMTAEEIAQAFQLPLNQVESILAFAAKNQERKA